MFLARENSRSAGFALERRILQSKTIVILVSAVSVDEIWSDVNKGCVSLRGGARYHSAFIYPAFILPLSASITIAWPLATLGEASVPREFGRQTGGWPGRLKARSHVCGSILTNEGHLVHVSAPGVSYERSSHSGAVSQ